MAGRKTSSAQTGCAPNPAPTGAYPNAGRCNGTALRKATRRVSQLYDSVLAPCGLKGTQRSVLIHVARAGTPTMGELSAALVLDRSALGHNLKPLERDGLIALVPDEQDKRSRRVALTPLGKAKLDASMALWAQAQARFEAVFGAAEAAALRASLERIASPEFAAAFAGREPRE
ncbi:MarR family winged helix-turn-helix transcriptional regulator [Roseixanthobacter liquoris]|uniref:MarR family winged helix-turn-helix transcriptional regulator n=1 Tax=Roseixanthobacter liquoris TaxID=3119921 RepID=UPI003728113C